MLAKFNHLPPKEWHMMYNLAKMFLHCLNHWKLETPTTRKQQMSVEEVAAYKVSCAYFPLVGSSNIPPVFLWPG